MPVGRPLPGRSAVIVDAYGKPQPAGIPGELCLGGAGLATGYLNQPELTRNRFIADPWRPNSKLYRTGDRARYLDDGTIEYLGRIDDQVKIRGYRVEPGEVEAVLMARSAGEPGSGCRPRVGEDKSLVAELDGRAGLRPEQRDATPAHAAAWLPDYIPTQRLRGPLGNAHDAGRQDRPPGHSRNRTSKSADRADAYEAPRNTTEELLAALWSDALAVRQTGIRDDFFARGGHSLLAARVVIRAREIFGEPLPLRWLFETPTVAGLAERISGTCPAAALTLPLVAPRESGAALPLSIAQEEFWVADRALPGVPFYNIPMAARLSGDIDPMVFARCCGELVRRHEALRTTFSAVDGAPGQVVHPPQPFSLEVVNLSAFELDRRELLMARLMHEFRRPCLDLERGPLLRAGIVTFGPADHVVLLTIHHIVGDGRSVEIMAGELEQMYPVLAAERPCPLPDIPVRYGDFTLWQRRMLAEGRFEPQLEYWGEKLGGELPPLPLPRDRRRPDVPPPFNTIGKPWRLRSGW